MDRVIDERGDRLAVAADGLDDPHSPVVEIRGVKVERDLPLGFRRSDAERRRPEGIEGFVDRLGRLPDDIIHPGEIPRVPPLPVGEGIAIGGAVGVGGGDENLLWRQAWHEGPHPVTEHGREAEDVDADDRHRRVAVGHDENPRGEFTALLGDGVGRPHPPRHRQERIGRDHPHRGAGPEIGRDGRFAENAQCDQTPTERKTSQQAITHRILFRGPSTGHFAAAGRSPS